MTSKQKILGYLGISTKAGKIIFGTEAVKEAIEKRKVKLIIVAEDAADRTKRNFDGLCQSKNIEFIIFGTIQENSKAIGQNNKAIIGVKDKNLSEVIRKNINGGEVIG